MKIFHDRVTMRTHQFIDTNDWDENEIKIMFNILRKHYNDQEVVTIN